MENAPKNEAENEMVFQIVFNLPTRALSSNYRGHTRGRRSLDTAVYRNNCEVGYRKAKIPVLTVVPAKGKRANRVTIDLDFYYGPTVRRGEIVADDYYRATDEDSARASFKAGQDALKDAGLIPDDNSTYVRCGETRLYRTWEEHEGKCELLVTLRVDSLPENVALSTKQERENLLYEASQKARAKLIARHIRNNKAKMPRGGRF